MTDDDIAANLHHIFETIRKTAHGVGRNPESIRVVAATKYVEADRIRRAYHAGIRLCGENRLQEALAKMLELGPLPGLGWHFIGRVQRRKIKSVIGNFDLVQSIESVEQAEEFHRCAERVGVVQPVLLEVNVGGEDNKGGFRPEELLGAIPVLDQLAHLHIKGLMAIPPRTSDPEQARPYFRQLHDWFQHIAGMSFQRVRMEELSMGMTEDYPIAIEEGATMVRIGRGIFGERRP